MDCGQEEDANQCNRFMSLHSVPDDPNDANIGCILKSAARPTISFEYFPPKTELGTTKLKEKMCHMRDMKPLWIDVTFKSGGARAADTLSLCVHARSVGLVPLVHITCIGMTTHDVDSILEYMFCNGLRNIMAIRGDPPGAGEEFNASGTDFQHAVDLVRYIKRKYGEYFFVAVAGYPECHPECTSLSEDIRYMKDKVDAGAELIITQMFYDEQLFISFVDKSREAGITCPIVPGIMPITSYSGFLKMIAFCDTKVPAYVLQDLESIKGDVDAVREYGIQLAVEMCKRLVLSRAADNIHLYTMNNEDNIREIVKQLAHVAAPIHSQWIG